MGDRPLPRYSRSGQAAFLSALGDRPLFIVSPVHGYAPEELLADARFERGEALHRVRFVAAVP